MCLTSPDRHWCAAHTNVFLLSGSESLETSGPSIVFSLPQVSVALGLDFKIMTGHVTALLTGGRVLSFILYLILYS